MTLIKINFFLLFTFIFIPYSYTQHTLTIEGIVEEENGVVLPYVSITLYDKTQNEAMAFTSSYNKGHFKLIFKENSQNHELGLKVISLGYETVEIPISNQEVSRFLRIKMAKSVTTLEEVKLISKDRGIRMRKDTTTYKLDKFLDGSEKKVIDILAKLPGIEVLESGKLKFKGKDVTALLLENDDLFSSNYSIGTKNISAEIVESIEAIERYSKNPLLKNIEQTDAVAINLKLKDKKISFSLYGLAGIGFKSRYLFDLNSLTVSKKVKNFSILNFNNSGQNNSNLDFASSSKIGAELSGATINPIAPLTPKSLNASDLDTKYVIRNKQFWANTNTSLKLSNKQNLKLNFNSFKDQLSTSNQLAEAFVLGDTLYNFVQNNSLNLNPSLFDITAELLSEINKKSNLNYIVNFSRLKNFYFSNFELNQARDSELTYADEEILTNHILNYTYKLNDKSALQLKGEFIYKEIVERNTYSDGTQLTSGDTILKQGLAQTQRGSLGKLEFLTKGSTFNFSQSLSVGHISQNLKTFLQTTDYTLLPYFNDAVNNYISLNTSYLKSFGKLNLGANNSVYFRDLTTLSGDLKKFSFDPTFSMSYYFNEKSSLEASYSFNQKPLDLVELNPTPIFRSIYYTTSYKDRSPILLNTQNISLNFKYYYPIRGLGLRASANHKTRFNPFISSTDVTNNSLNTILVISNKSNQLFNTTLVADKLFFDWFSKFSVRFDYVNFIYDNRISGVVQENKLNSYLTKLDYQSSFTGKVNFGTSFTFGVSNNKSVNNLTTVRFVENKLDINYNPIKQIKVRFNAKGIIPDLDNGTDLIIILNSSLEYRPNDKKYTLNASFNNLSNQNRFTRTTVTELGQSTYIENIIPFNFLISYSYQLF
tara:strand:- start:61 stop:2694 length:2634 start_codon:yes stop_codon:yes gene_type:complete